MNHTHDFNLVIQNSLKNQISTFDQTTRPRNDMRHWLSALGKTTQTIDAIPDSLEKALSCKRVFLGNEIPDTQEVPISKRTDLDLINFQDGFAF